jgi:hypothetical protein
MMMMMMMMMKDNAIIRGLVLLSQAHVRKGAKAVHRTRESFFSPPKYFHSGGQDLSGGRVLHLIEVGSFKKYESQHQNNLSGMALKSENEKILMK